MLKKWLFICILLVMVFVSAASPVLAKSKKGAANEWSEQEIFSGLEKSLKNPNAALSKVEFASLVNRVFGYEDKEADYWETVLEDEASKNSVIKQEDAVELMTYLMPEEEKLTSNELSVKAEKPLKVSKAMEIFDRLIEQTYTTPGTYQDETIEGTAVISSADVTLENTTITGDLYITQGTKEGWTKLENVTVEGTIYVHNQVQNHVRLIDSDVNQVKIYEPGQKETDWSLVWSDEFMTAEIDDSKWTYDIGNWIVDENGEGISPGWGNNEQEYYTDSPENSYIEDGKMVIKAQKEEEPITDQFGSYDYTSAKLKTKGLFSKKYGKFEARMKLPEGQGFWPAFWMMPEDSVYGEWAASGEIDIMEAAGKDTSNIGGTIHYGEQYPNNTYRGTEYHFPEGTDYTDYHTYSVEWEPGEIRWYVDGELYQTLNNWFSKGEDEAANYTYPAPFDQEFYLIMNLAVGGWYGGNADETTPFPGIMEVDYVRVYELTGRDYKEPVKPEVEEEELPEDAKQPLEDGNLIYDNQYTREINQVNSGSDSYDPLYWNFLQLPDFEGAGSISTSDVDGETFAKTEISNPGNALWSLQLIQNAAIVEGHTYKVSFDAKSNTSRNMMTKVSGGAERGYANYSGEQSIALSDQVQSYEYTFTLNQDTDLAARLEFNMGANGTAPVWIGNVRMEDITGTEETSDQKTPLPDGNHVYNGTFDQGDQSRMIYWNVNTTEDADAEASVDSETRELHLDVSEGGDSPEAVQLSQTGLQFLKGNTYALTFEGRAEENQSIEVAFLSKDGTVRYAEQEVQLTNDMNTHEVTFEMPQDITDREGQLVFNTGGKSASIYLDNVVLLQTSSFIDYSNVDLYPLTNGDFTAGLDNWSTYIHFDAGAEITADSGELEAHITNPGNEMWSVLLEQPGLQLSKGVTYELSFDARSTVARDIELTVENASYQRYFSEKISLGTETQSFDYEWNMTADDTASLKFLMGQFAEAHDIYIDNVVLQVKNASEYE